MDIQHSRLESPSGPLKLKSGWFNSLKHVVHQTSVSAKSAIDAVRGQHGYVDLEKGPSSSAPNVGSAHGHPCDAEAISTEFPALQRCHALTQSRRASTRSSLRHTLSRSLTVKRGSISTLFRSDSLASSIKGPENFVKDEITDEDMPPHNPISNQPPTLKLNLGVSHSLMSTASIVQVMESPRTPEDTPSSIALESPLPLWRNLSIREIRCPVSHHEMGLSVRRLPTPPCSPRRRERKDSAMSIGASIEKAAPTDDVRPAETSTRTENTIPTNDMRTAETAIQTENSIPFHGPPSPTRSVQLPFRMKSTSRSVKETYFPQIVIPTPLFAQTSRYSSLDTTGSHEAFDPSTPLRSTDATRGSSPSTPSRTPSMGDRSAFDLVREERERRYKAIFESCAHAATQEELGLPDFESAGPGSQGSSPVSALNEMRHGFEGLMGMKE